MLSPSCQIKRENKDIVTLAGICKIYIKWTFSCLTGRRWCNKTWKKKTWELRNWGLIQERSEENLEDDTKDGPKLVSVQQSWVTAGRDERMGRLLKRFLQELTKEQIWPYGKSTLRGAVHTSWYNMPESIVRVAGEPHFPGMGVEDGSPGGDLARLWSQCGSRWERCQIRALPARLPQHGRCLPGWQRNWAHRVQVSLLWIPSSSADGTGLLWCPTRSPVVPLSLLNVWLGLILPSILPRYASSGAGALGPIL